LCHNSGEQTTVDIHCLFQKLAQRGRMVAFVLIEVVKKLSETLGRSGAMHIRTILSYCLFLAILTGAAAQTAPPQADQSQAQIGYKSAADADAKKTLLLKDFQPTSMLHAPTHNVDKAKYYVIDVHNHQNDAMGIDDHMPPERVVEIMNKTNVKTVVILTGMWGEKLQGVIDASLFFHRSTSARSMTRTLARKWWRNSTTP
jgi:hypothetical protein